MITHFISYISALYMRIFMFIKSTAMISYEIFYSLYELLIIWSMLIKSLFFTSLLFLTYALIGMNSVLGMKTLLTLSFSADMTLQFVLNKGSGVSMIYFYNKDNVVVYASYLPIFTVSFIICFVLVLNLAIIRYSAYYRKVLEEYVGLKLLKEWDFKSNPWNFKQLTELLGESKSVATAGAALFGFATYAQSNQNKAEEAKDERKLQFIKTVHANEMEKLEFTKKAAEEAAQTALKNVKEFALLSKHKANITELNKVYTDNRASLVAPFTPSSTKTITDHSVHGLKFDTQGLSLGGLKMTTKALPTNPITMHDVVRGKDIVENVMEHTKAIEKSNSSSSMYEYTIAKGVEFAKFYGDWVQK